MAFWRKKAPLLTPVQARLRLISKLEEEIRRFEKEVDDIELRLRGAAAKIREYIHDRARSSEPRRWDPDISAKQEFIHVCRSQLEEDHAAIRERQERIVALYDEIDSIYRFGVGPDREESARV